MCGIAGIINLKGEAADEKKVEQMLWAMDHRGPDEKGVFSSKNHGFSFGTARLAINDLKSGRQPIANEDKTIWTVCNGEIYNFLELREELIEKGHRFASNSDSEVIVHSYEEWGEDFLLKIKGMFGLALFDADKNVFYLARDVMGEKPLFYFSSGDFFAFASEMRPLLKFLPIKREINPLAIQSFFLYSRPVNDLCAYQEIKKLLPRQFLKIDLAANRTEIKNYYQFNFAKLDLTEKEAEEVLLKTLERAMVKHLIADVPIGAFLSGGVDSSALVALMRRSFNKPVKTFTAIYDDEVISEAKEARQVARILNTDHYEVLIQPKDVISVLPKLISHLEEPFGDASFVPAYFVSEKAGAQVKVAITGDGGDELFGGYETYYAWQWLEKYRKIPGAIRSLWEGAINHLPLSILIQRPRYYRLLSGAQKIIRAAAEQDDLKSFFKMTERGGGEKIISRDVLEKLYQKRLADWPKAANLSSLEKIMAFQASSLLPELFFTKIDRMSMANSLETRSPLVYREVMELALRLPVNLKIRGRQGKYLLKKVFAGFLPPQLLSRPKKGFSIPFYRWLREDRDLRSLVEESVFSAVAKENLENYGINNDYLRAETKKYLEKKNNNWTLPWRAVCFNLWRTNKI